MAILLAGSLLNLYYYLRLFSSALASAVKKHGLERKDLPFHLPLLLMLVNALGGLLIMLMLCIKSENIAHDFGSCFGG